MYTASGTRHQIDSTFRGGFYFTTFSPSLARIPVTVTSYSPRPGPSPASPLSSASSFRPSISPLSLFLRLTQPRSSCLRPLLADFGPHRQSGSCLAQLGLAAMASDPPQEFWLYGYGYAP